MEMVLENCVRKEHDSFIVSNLKLKSSRKRISFFTAIKVPGYKRHLHFEPFGFFWYTTRIGDDYSLPQKQTYKLLERIYNEKNDS